MEGIAIAVRPRTETIDGHVLFQDQNHALQKYYLKVSQSIHISVLDPSRRYCTGWYDITTHTNHPCEHQKIISEKHESCFACRQKTGFNPAFYNSTAISAVQKTYNNHPHTVYIAYFGAQLAKAGIMSDSRGLERLYEQGALFYAIIGSFETAGLAHSMEDKLIACGLKNSVSKKQKEKVLSNKFNQQLEEELFTQILKSLDLKNPYKVVSNLEHFLYNTEHIEQITPYTKTPFSGTIGGLVGRYLVVKNGDRLYGFWLSDLLGRMVKLESRVEPLKSEALQMSLL